MTRRLALPLRALALGTLALGAVACSASDTGPRPSVLLIVIDTLRADRLGCYGAERPTSPAIDALAADAVRYARAYAPAPWTQPTVASLLTGLYPSGHGVVRIRTRLPDTVTTLAELLRRRGYATGAVVSHFLVGSTFGFARGFDVFDESEARGHAHVSTPGVTAKARALLRRFTEADRPFFLLVHYFDPHYTYQRHPEFGFAGPGAGRLEGGESIQQIREWMHDMTPDEVGFLRDLYDEEVRFTDAGVARLLDTLRARERYADTVIALVADHGEEFLEHGWIGHTRTLYEELIRVPLLVRPPGGPADERVIETPVSAVSLLPSLLALLSIEAPEAARQAPPLPGLGSRNADGVAPVLAEVDFDPIDPRYAEKTAHKKALVTARFKLVRDDRSGELELFDLAADPHETKNLAVEQAERGRELAAVLETRLAALRAPGGLGDELALSPEQIEMLRDLGYVGR